METTLEVLRARKSGPEVHRRWPDEVKEGRRIYTHVNNTNPALMPDSEARATITAAGWEIANDGLEIVL